MWQYVRKYLCRLPQKLATRLAEAVEMRGGKVVFKIQPFVLFILIFVVYHMPCVQARESQRSGRSVLWSLAAATPEAHAAEPVLHSKRSHSEKPAHRREEQPLLAAARGKPAQQ